MATAWDKRRSYSAWVGFARLLLQIGRGPRPTVPAAPPLAVEVYDFKPSLDADMRACALLVSARRVAPRPSAPCGGQRFPRVFWA